MTRPRKVCKCHKTLLKVLPGAAGNDKDALNLSNLIYTCLEICKYPPQEVALWWAMCEALM